MIDITVEQEQPVVWLSVSFPLTSLGEVSVMWWCKQTYVPMYELLNLIETHKNVTYSNTCRTWPACHVCCVYIFQIFIEHSLHFRESTSDDKNAKNTKLYSMRKHTFDGINLYTFPYFCSFWIMGHTNIRPPATNAGLLWQTPAKENGEKQHDIIAFRFLFTINACNVQKHLRYSILFHASDFLDFTTKAQRLTYKVLRKYLIRPWPHSVHTFRRKPFWNLTSLQKFLVREQNNMATRSRDLLWRRLLILVDI